MCDSDFLRRTVAELSRATIAEKFAPAVIGARYRRRLEATAGF